MFRRREKPSFDDIRQGLAALQKQSQALEEAILQLGADNERLRAENQQLQMRNQRLAEENAALREELKNSTPKPPPIHPSTPSGMVPVYQKPGAKGRRKKPGRKDGHPGARRAMPERIDDEVPHVLSRCPDCGVALGEAAETRTRLVEDLPPVQTLVTRHVVHRYYCPSCKKIVGPAVDAALPKMQIGVRLLMTTAFLHYSMGVTVNHVRTWLATFASFHVSAGGLTAAWARLAQWLNPLYETLAQEARDSDVIHADETGWRVSGQSAWWLWCFANNRLVYYVIARCRGSTVVADALGEMFGGTLVCDFFGAYNLIVAADKQRCVVHLFRALKSALEKNPSAEWAAFHKKLRRLLRDAMRLDERWDGSAACAAKKRRLHDRLAALCSAAHADRDCRRIVKRLKRCADELFTFVGNPAVPADNNLAEREIRPGVVMRKNSYCNRSERGAETQAILMSLFRTLHRRGADPVETLCASLKAALVTGRLTPLPCPSASDG